MKWKYESNTCTSSFSFPIKITTFYTVQLQSKKSHSYAYKFIDS